MENKGVNMTSKLEKLLKDARNTRSDMQLSDKYKQLFGGLLEYIDILENKAKSKG